MLKIFYRFTLSKYVLASRIGGVSSDNLYQTYKGKYINTAIEHIKKSNKLKGITIATTPNQCKHCLEILLKKTKNRIVACDTQTIDLDPKKQSPVGHGHIICMSIFGGPEINFGNGPRLFVDNFGINAGLIDIFKPYLQNDEYLKVWHNYGFDRHLFFNHGINIRGFGGDTMHMARLFDSSKGPKEYSLTRLTESYKKQIQKKRQKYIQNLNNQINKKLALQNDESKRKQYVQQLQSLLKYQKQYSHGSLKKIKIEELFKRKKTLISGTEGKTYEYPSVLTLHTDSKYISQWIKYSILDSESTFFLRETLQRFLTIQQTKLSNNIKNMWELYVKYWRPFGQLLTDMERTGIKINLEHINKIKQKAIQHSEIKRLQFLQFISGCQNSQNIDLFNPSSPRQMQQLLHAPFIVGVKQEKKDESNQYNQQEYQEDLENDFEEEDLLGNKVINRKIITQLPQVDSFNVKNISTSRGKKVLKMEIKGFGIPPIKITPTGLPSVDFQSLKSLAGNPKEKIYGKAYHYFKQKGDQAFGIKLCQALDTLIQYRNIQTLLKTFIEPLNDYGDQQSRIHCSLNINTQTGRLSARKPNLQNQPALQKDIYKIRYAFEAEKGNKLIVADYGQLQLRILAHITNCKAMIDAFKQGGDFHSRTAIGMFPYIKQQIQKGLILLEWDKSRGAPPVPLLKDKFASQRRKAKTMNFSIAYGKTAHGFAQDWNCSIEQAKQSLEAWFSQRQQVRKWQNQKKKIAQAGRYTQTLLGRYRYLYKYFEGSEKVKMNLRNMAFRRAINTPIQGGAADIVIAAMVKIHDDEKLRKMGWKLLLQIHDELILEGPQQSSKQALEIVKNLMQNPLDEKLLINLEVDAKIGNNWYECK